MTAPQASASRDRALSDQESQLSPSKAKGSAASEGSPVRQEQGGLVIVANRLPVSRVRRDGKAHWERSPGGLVSALSPLLEQRHGTWVGWPGAPGEIQVPREVSGLGLRSVELSREEIELFYAGFSNGILWPLYHDAVRWPEFERGWWEPYVEVNRRFADAAVAATLDAGAEAPPIWVHDYQLQLVPELIRRRLPKARIGFFLHIPFPPAELFSQLPWRKQILLGLLGADVIGFQTKGGARNFLHVVQRYLGIPSKGGELSFEGRQIRVGAYPISIDTTEIQALASRAEVRQRAREIRARFGGRRLILGVDRLDYTKGIDRRLAAFELLLERDPPWRDGVTLVQIAVPSREAVPEYAQMRERIESKVGHINGRFGEAGRAPVQYLYRSLPFEELAAWYLAADVMAVTPLRDGMNLVAKEFVASRVDQDGVLVLSEFAGAAAELTQALLVNPHDVEGMADVFRQALELPAAERKARLTAMQRSLRRRDVHLWAREFLDDLATSPKTADPHGADR